MGYMSKTCVVNIAKQHRMKFFCDFFVGSLGSLRFLPYFCIAIGTQGSLAKSQRAQLAETWQPERLTAANELHEVIETIT